MHKLPVTVICGFPGAGKTTLINHLSGYHRLPNVAIVNPENGGVDELIERIRPLFQCSSQTPERLILEIPGRLDPGAVLQLFQSDPLISERLALDLIVTVVDALHLPRQMEDERVVEQIAFADTLIVNKCDLLDEAHVLALIKRLHRVNGTAQVIATRHGRVQPSQIFDTRLPGAWLV